MVFVASVALAGSIPNATLLPDAQEREVGEAVIVGQVGAVAVPISHAGGAGPTATVMVSQEFEGGVGVHAVIGLAPWVWTAYTEGPVWAGGAGLRARLLSTRSFGLGAFAEFVSIGLEGPAIAGVLGGLAVEGGWERLRIDASMSLVGGAGLYADEWMLLDYPHVLAASEVGVRSIHGNNEYRFAVWPPLEFRWMRWLGDWGLGAYGRSSGVVHAGGFMLAARTLPDGRR